MNFVLPLESSIRFVALIKAPKANLYEPFRGPAAVCTAVADVPVVEVVVIVVDVRWQLQQRPEVKFAFGNCGLQANCHRR